MAIFKYQTANPVRSLTISATCREEADTKFKQMRDAAGLTEESLLTQVIEISTMENIVEHASQVDPTNSDDQPK